MQGQGPTVLTWALFGFFGGAFASYAALVLQEDSRIFLSLYGGVLSALIVGLFRFVWVLKREAQTSVCVPEDHDKHSAKALVALLEQARHGDEMEAWRALPHLAAYRDEQVMERMMVCLDERLSDPNTLTSDPEGLARQARKACDNHGGAVGRQVVEKIADRKTGPLGSIARRVRSSEIIK